MEIKIVGGFKKKGLAIYMPNKHIQSYNGKNNKKNIGKAITPHTLGHKIASSYRELGRNLSLWAGYSIAT